MKIPDGKQGVFQHSIHNIINICKTVNQQKGIKQVIAVKFISSPFLGSGRIYVYIYT